MRPTALALMVLAACLSGPLLADVGESTPGSFVVQSVYDIDASPTTVYQSLVGSVGAWWDPDHTFGGDSAAMSIEARPQGCFCERLESGGVRHMTVVYAGPGKLLRLVGGLGPLQSEAVTGSLSWNLGEHEGGTRLIVTYKVAGYAPDGLEQWAGPVDEVLAQAARRLKKFVETGSPE